LIPASRFRLPFGKAKSQCSTMLPANCRSRVEFRDLFFHRSSRSDRTIRVFSFEFLVFSNHSKPTTKNSKLCRLLTARREAIEPRGIISFCFLLSAFCFLLSASCFLLPASCSLLPASRFPHPHVPASPHLRISVSPRLRVSASPHLRIPTSPLPLPASCSPLHPSPLTLHSSFPLLYYAGFGIIILCWPNL